MNEIKKYHTIKSVSEGKKKKDISEASVRHFVSITSVKLPDFLK
jgi:hypothetical protein